MDFGESTLDDLIRVQEQIRTDNRRLSHRFAEALSASSNLKSTETPQTPNNNEDYLEEVPGASLTVRKAATTRKRTRSGSSEGSGSNPGNMETKMDRVLERMVTK